MKVKLVVLMACSALLGSYLVTAVASGTANPVTAAKSVIDKKARKDSASALRNAKLARKEAHQAVVMHDESFRSDQANAELSRQALNAVEQAQKDANRALAAVATGVGTFTDGQMVTVTSQRDDGEYDGPGFPPNPVGTGEITFRHVDCPKGTAVASGGYVLTTPNSGGVPRITVYFTIRSGNGWSVGFNNSANTSPATVQVEATCAPSDRGTSGPNSFAREEALVALQKGL